MLQSANKEYSLQKCQKFTSPLMVHTLLDSVDYCKNLYGHKVLENSFGNGNILVEIVKRYIADCKQQNIPPNKIRIGLANDIHGFEISREHYQTCINRLNEITKIEGIGDIEWTNIRLNNFLEFSSETLYDYIIANPPYIDYRNMDMSTRKELKENFLSCKNGKFDYCYPFIEKSINLLNKTGKLSMLLPVNVYKNKFGTNLRNLMREKAKKIIVYPGQLHFQDALTSSSIFVYDKTYTGDKIIFENDTEKNISHINKNALIASKWIFNTLTDTKDEKYRFGDVFHVSMVIATLCNKAFIVSEDEIEKEKLETDVIRVAASPKNLNTQKKEFIIFPYRYEHDNILRYSDKEFCAKFPNAVNHLKRHEEKLLKRNSDTHSSWFEYGRSQGLRIMNQRKLLLSTITTQKVHVYDLDSSVIPYAGIMITQKDSDFPLEEAKKILKSQDFLKYIKDVGINVNNASIRILSSDIKNYYFARGQA